MDICFCNNKECNKRKNCLRAIENHNKDNLAPYISVAEFKCTKEDKESYFIKMKR